MIKYMEIKIVVSEFSDTNAICEELDVYGVDGWLLVSPLVRVDDGSLVGIAARDESMAVTELERRGRAGEPLTDDEVAELKRLAGLANKNPRGRPPKEKDEV